MKLANLFPYIEYHLNYVLWCIRNPRFITHFCNIGAGCRFDIGRKAQLSFGRDVYFRWRFTGDFYGKVILGDGVAFQHDCHVSVHKELIIGDYSIFGEGVSIHDENHIVTDGADPIGDRDYIVKPITIGKNVWVGAKATILSGITIGDNAVVGAHAVVTHDVPAYAIVGGVPARVIREIKPSTSSLVQ